ncbi:NUDIX domain-containing protein [Hamadaea sp.]|uniref:NUDIX hydrolase n=1 Tax=Hamadaea sp. TaxID=2024425 RepID=UPI0025C5C2E9|nr:NUDIX domain-containing protein [Hamadaea sp.]
MTVAPPSQCGRCAYQQYVNARPTASLIVLDDAGRFLALKRAREPQAGLWETPGGFCDGWEHPAEAAVREGREELGVDVVLGDFVGMYVGSYLFQDELLPVLDCFWLARLPAGELTLDPEESSEMAWFPLVTPPAMAFGTMDRALTDAVQILCRKDQFAE